MVYATPQDVRDIIGLEREDADDEILEKFIVRAQNVVIKYIQVREKDEVMSGSVNGTNTTFSVSNPYIADTNFDEEITTDDFTIYGWGKAGHPDTKTELTCSTFYPEDGIFVLSSAPDSNTYKQITCDYSWYVSRVDWTLVEMATAYYAAFLFVARELYLVPESWGLGNLRIRRTEPWKLLREDFYKVIDLLVMYPMDKVSYRKMMVAPRKRFKFFGPGTVEQYLDRVTSEKNIY